MMPAGLFVLALVLKALFNLGVAIMLGGIVVVVLTQAGGLEIDWISEGLCELGTTAFCISEGVGN